MQVRNAEVADNNRIVFRVGVHVGDIIIEGEDILGDGVNIAARIEALAEPGGVAISGRAHDDVRDRLDVDFSDIGEQNLKNIARPVRIWHWLPSSARPDVSTDTDALAPRPDKPSIAVLPFDNMSGDPEQEYFADGMTEDIITALSKYRWGSVTARNSTFSYNGQAVNVRQIGDELRVRYVLEGSIRRSGNRIRVTAQLMETATGNHVWADRFDGDLDDIFDLQDEVTRQIVGFVAPEIQEAEMFSAVRKQSHDLTEWEKLMRARWHVNKFNRTDMETAETMLSALISASPL